MLISVQQNYQWRFENGGDHQNPNPYVWQLSSLAETASDFHISRFNYHMGYNIGPIFFTVRWPHIVGENRVVIATNMEIAEKVFGLEVIKGGNLRWPSGSEMHFSQDCETLKKCRPIGSGRYGNGDENFNFSFDHIQDIHRNLHFGPDNMARFLAGLAASDWEYKMPEQKGIKKAWSSIDPLLDLVKREDVRAYCSILTLAHHSNRTIDGVKVSSVFNDIFGIKLDVDDTDSTRKAVTTLVERGVAFWEASHRNNLLYLEDGIRKSKVFLPKRKQVLKRQGNRAFTLLMREYENLGIDEKKYPRTTKAIKEGMLPIGVFFRKSEQYFIFNDNWSLWEKMLKLHPEVAVELAHEVAGRTTYEKDLMSYFYFVLERLPKYLRKYTKRKWTCIPRVVKDSNELEAPSADDSGTARSRSALTPIVDNENSTVTVPYASLRVPGVQTTYTYGLDFHVLTEGQSFRGNVVSDEVEKELNGKDDYGLMYYTLTGSAQGRGYPTFLIIFERLTGGRPDDVSMHPASYTRVHFHRTHPFRSKNGDYNPVHNWIKGCYNWMAGNINRDRIIAQQGDLMFIADDCGKVDWDAGGSVNEYDSHRFNGPVQFVEFTGKDKNVVGFVNLEEDMPLKHLEHEQIVIPEGTYIIRQCRSWEANPKGIWTLNID
jgi:hypothetical protein